MRCACTDHLMRLIHGRRSPSVSLSENCPSLSKITVNQVIWDRVSAEARTGDVKMQWVQNALVKGTTNVALIADLVLKSSEVKDNIDTTALLDKLWKLTKDSLCCLGAANWELVQGRREAFKPQISKDYAPLCAQKVKFTDSLFWRRRYQTNQRYHRWQ